MAPSAERPTARPSRTALPECPVLPASPLPSAPEPSTSPCQVPPTECPFLLASPLRHGRGTLCLGSRLAGAGEGADG